MGSLHRLVPFMFVLAGALAAPAFAGDIVINQQGKALGNPKAGNPPSAEDFNGSQWEISDWTLDGVTYRIPDVPQPQTLGAASVKAVYFDPQSIPADLSKGKLLAEPGNGAGARESLARVQKDAEAMPWAKAEAAYRAAVTFLDDGNPGEAANALGAFKSSFPKSKWISTATEMRARALLALGKIEDAKGEFSSLKKMAGVPEDVVIEGDYWLIWIDEQVASNKGDPGVLTAVSKAYDDLITRLQGKSQFESLMRRCQVGRASCMILTGKPDAARDTLEKLSKETKDERTLAGIYNKLGTATWRAAPTDKAAMRAALYHYLRVVTLYGEAAGAEDDCAEAMFHAGELFRELKDQGADWPSRARREWSEVVSTYPGTVWAQKSKEALAGR
ncbi:MAG: hypothetical protein K8T90_09530 [Planctomycetes bacterium]|nr:hypothetical protein [Planctomycetota bacterium]